MKAHSLRIPYRDDNEKDLEQLLDAFGSVVSLEDIASAYCRAGWDVYAAGEILSSLQGSTSGASTSTSNDELEGLSVSPEWSDDNLIDKSNIAEKNSVSSKQKKYSVSVGTVSGVIGREYTRTRPSRSESSDVVKPLKLNSAELPMSEIWGEKDPPSRKAMLNSMHKDTEKFLFKMLGDGFQLDMKIIQDVLGLCGYDVERSMETLLDLSASTLEKSGDVVDMPAETPMEKYTDMKSLSCQEKTQCNNSGRSNKARSVSRNESSKSQKERYDIQKQVLEALFNVPQRSEEAPKRIRPMKPVRGSRGFGQTVVEPLTDAKADRRTPVAKLLVTQDENEEDEDSYQTLRKAVKEHWVTMKEYYKAAVDAFAKGDHERAYKLLEKGHVYKEKARETDEKSAEKFLKSSEEGMSLDLHEHNPKEAIRLLRVHLTSLSGIPSIHNLKVVVGAKADDIKEGARRRRVIKFLDGESIKWTEEESGRTIVIRLDEIDPKRLSFFDKK